jgi:hypothetical protein
MMLSAEDFRFKVFKLEVQTTSKCNFFFLEVPGERDTVKHTLML